MMFQHAIDNDGATYVDYLRGDEPYKQEWTPLLRNRIGLEVYNKSLCGYAVDVLMKKVVPVMKKRTDNSNKNI